jgi:hypothetical protein
VNATARRIRAFIAAVALIVVAGLATLKGAGADEKLLRVLAIGGGLLVTMLFVTYRALLRLAEAAGAAARPPLPDDDKDAR